MAMGLPNLGLLPPNPPATTAGANTTTDAFDSDTGTSLSVEDPSKKIRKPYTITKSRQSWTEPEHDKFLEALQLFDRDWKKIEAFIGSKTVIQIRSHAQKYFVKVQKSGTNEHLPPPRPKRKAAHPYPQKASKNAAAPVLKQGASFQASPALSEPGLIQKADTSSTARPTVSGASIPCRSDNSVETASLLHVKEGNTRSSEEQGVGNFSFCGDEAMRKTQPIGQMTQLNNISSLRVLPDFAQVYSFIGSIFDPNASGHLQKLKKMDCIDVETVLLLMRNLSINLSSPDFEEHRKLLSSYEIDADKDDVKVGNNAIRDGLSENPV